MTTVAELAQKVRAALAVNAEYEAVTIPSAIRRVMKRLLRDYNFPKSVKRYQGGDIMSGQYAHPLPPGLKRPLEVRFFNPADNTWSSRLERREGFTLPYADEDVDSRYGRYYWLEGNNLVVDTPMPVGGSGLISPLKLVLWYQSMLLDLETMTWMLDEMEDLIFTSSVVRAAAELRKAEAMQAFAPLLTEEMTSIAIYANELEWNGVGMQMREPRGLPTPRYPAGGTI